MRAKLIIVFCAVVACLVGPPSTALSDTGILNACWSPEDLKTKPGERRIKRQRARTQTPKLDDHDLHSQSVAKHLRGAIRRVTLPKGKKWVALTLDFCEQTHEVAGYDGAIFDFLRQETVPATLFVGGKWMRSHPERTQQLMADPLFELANHSDTHKNLRVLSPAHMRDEIYRPQKTYRTLRKELRARACTKDQRADQERPVQDMKYFRFPYGACNHQALDAVNTAGLMAIQWDFSSWDSSRAQSARRIARRMVGEVRSGSIILAHANGRGYHTAGALRIAIPKLRNKGFRFVTVSQLLAAGTPVIKQRCYNMRPGDTDRYDRLFRRRTSPKKTKSPRGSGSTP